MCGGKKCVGHCKIIRMKESCSLVVDPLRTAGGAIVFCGLLEDKATMTEQEMTA